MSLLKVNNIQTLSGALDVVASDLTLNGVSVGSSALYDFQTFDNTDVTLDTVTITHTTGKKYNIIQIFDDSDETVFSPSTMVDTTSFTLDLSGLTPISGTWSVAIVGIS